MWQRQGKFFDGIDGRAQCPVVDINNDGLDDIFFSGNEVNDQLYLNQGNMVFKNISKSSGIANQNNWSTGASMADVNNDGFIDIYVSTVSDYKNLKGHNRLYINNGDLTFTESSKKIGLDKNGLKEKLKNNFCKQTY